MNAPAFAQPTLERSFVMPKQNSRLRDVNAEPTATLNVDIRFRHTSGEELEEWKIDGAIYAHMLSRPDCPEAFRRAFTDIFTEHLFEECQAAHPAIIATLFPLVVGHLQGWIPVEAYRTVLVLRTLRDTLAPELAKKIRDELKCD
jgi:hypothetical protein